MEGRTSLSQPWSPPLQVGGDLVITGPFSAPTVPSLLPVDLFKDNGHPRSHSSFLSVIDAGVEVNIETYISAWQTFPLIYLSAKWLSCPLHCLQSIYTTPPHYTVAVVEIGRHQGGIKVPVRGAAHDMRSNEVHVARYEYQEAPGDSRSAFASYLGGILVMIQWLQSKLQRAAILGAVKS